MTTNRLPLISPLSTYVSEVVVIGKVGEVVIPYDNCKSCFRGCVGGDENGFLILDYRPATTELIREINANPSKIKYFKRIFSKPANAEVKLSPKGTIDQIVFRGSKNRTRRKLYIAITKTKGVPTKLVRIKFFWMLMQPFVIDGEKNYYFVGCV